MAKFSDYGSSDYLRNGVYKLFSKQLEHDDKNVWARQSGEDDYNVVCKVYMNESKKKYVLVGVSFEWSKNMVKILFGGSADRSVKAEWKMSDYTVESLSKWIIKMARIFSGLVGILEDQCYTEY